MGIEKLTTELEKAFNLFAKAKVVYDKRIKYDREWMQLDDELRALTGYGYNEMADLFPGEDGE